MAGSTKELIREVEGLAKSEFLRLGWRKRAGDIYTLNLTPEVIGWAGLNRATGRGQGWVKIYPVVGVRHNALERAVAELLGVRPHPYNPTTVMHNVGYLMPAKTYAEWTFTLDTDSERIAKAMVACVEIYGRPFIESRKSLEALIADMERMPESEMFAYRLPTAYLLAGHPATAAQKLNERARRMSGGYVEFANRLRARIEQAGVSYRWDPWSGVAQEPEPLGPFATARPPVRESNRAGIEGEIERALAGIPEVKRIAFESDVAPVEVWVYATSWAACDAVMAAVGRIKRARKLPFGEVGTHFTVVD